MKVFIWMVGGLTLAALNSPATAAPEAPGPATVHPTAAAVMTVPQDPPPRSEWRLRSEVERALERAQRELERAQREGAFDQERMQREMERALRDTERQMRELDFEGVERLTREAERMARRVEDEFRLRWQDPPPLPPLPPIPPIPDLDLRALDVQVLADLDLQVPYLQVFADLDLQDIGRALDDFDYAFDYDFDYAFDYGFDHVLDLAIDIDSPVFDVGRSGRLLDLLELTYQDPQDPGLQRFNEAKTFLFDQRYQEAFERFRQVIEQFARSAYVDDAAFWASYALEQIRDRREEAFRSYQDFLQSYTGSPFVEHARANMVRLAGLLYRQGMEQYKQYIEEARGDEEDEIRLYALHALVQQEGEDAVGLIEGVLADGSASSRLKREAIDLLRRQSDPRAAQVLERTAREHADPEVRRQAISGLGSRQDRAGFDALTRLYPNERSVNARRYIADAAGAYRQADFAGEAAAFLARIIENDTDTDARRTAVSELKAFPNEIAMPHLRRLLERVTDETVKRSLLSAVASSKDPENIALLRSQIRTSTDERVQRAAVEYIGSIEGPEALDALIDIANENGTEAVRVEAVDQIGDFAGSRAATALIAIARSGAPVAVRREALDELGNRRTPESFAALREVATGAGDTGLRGKAVAELAGWGAEAAPVLQQIALNDAESDLRRTAVSALGGLGDGAGWDALVNVYQNSGETRLRRSALDYLWRINEERSLDTVIAAARADTDSEVRRHAVQMLGRSESERAKQALREILNIPPREGV